MPTNPNPRRRARIESLEPKQMLAGDVMVGVIGGNLVVHGDDADNQIAIHSGEEPGQFVVVGLDGTNVMRAGGDPNGGGEEGTAPDRAVVVNGVSRGARVAMGAGNDTVIVNDARFRGRVGIATGAGEDTVLVGVRPDGPDGPPTTDPGGEGAGDVGPAVAIGHSLGISTGADGDHVHVGNARIGGRLRIGTDGGDDTVLLGRPASTDPAAEIAESDTPPALAVGRSIGVGLGAGNDNLVVTNVRSLGIGATGGLGDDNLRVANTQSARLHLGGGIGAGNDSIGVNNANAIVATLRTGGGEDHVAVADSAFGLLAAGLGAGNDSLALDGVSARLALLSGGAGDEDLLVLGENMIAHQRVRGFELPPITDPNDDEGDVA